MMQPLAPVDLYVALAFVPLLLITALFDLREMRIPNWLSWAGLAVFAATLPVLGIDAWFMRALVGLAAFVICFGLFAVNWLGGGDAKIFPVTMLFVPMSHIAIYMFSFSVAMIVGMIVIWLARQQFSHPQARWVSMKPGAAFPMGISIAASLPLALGVALAIAA